MFQSLRSAILDIDEADIDDSQIVALSRRTGLGGSQIDPVNCNADFGISYSFSGIVSINGQPASETVFNALPVDGTTRNAVWDIGNVVTEVEDDVTVQAVTPTIRIQYYGRVNNDLVTNAGSTLQNGVVANYTNGENGGQEMLADATAAIVAIEPVLTATGNRFKGS